MTVQGKGWYLWKVRDCENGDPNAILAEAQKASLSHVMIKVANGGNTYNFDHQRRIDLVLPVVKVLKAAGIQAWGWQYVYGNDPLSEARKAIQRIRELDLDGFVVNAEVEYKEPGKDVAARKYMKELRAAFPNLPIALSSYRFPSYHPQFPFSDFLTYCDLNMPQVYWQGAHNPATQLSKTVREFRNLSPNRPIIPTGSAYGAGSWVPTEEDVHEFLQSAKTMGLSAANFWSWDYTRQRLPALWDRISDFPWTGAPTTPDIVHRYIEALNTRDPLNVTTMYALNGVHITTTHSVQGMEKILTWYNTFLNQTMPSATFNLTGYSGSGSSRHFTWTAASPQGKILNGNDTIGIHDDKISYHYTYFNILQP